MSAGDLREAVARVRSACNDLTLDDQLTTFQIAWLIAASLAREAKGQQLPTDGFDEAQGRQLEDLEDMADDVLHDFPDPTFVRLYETGNLEVVWKERADRAEPHPPEDSPFGAIPWPRVSRLNDDEMKALRIDIVDRTYHFLHRLLDERAGSELLSLLVDRDLAPEWKTPTLGSRGRPWR